MVLTFTMSVTLALIVKDPHSSDASSLPKSPWSSNHYDVIAYAYSSNDDAHIHGCNPTHRDKSLLQTIVDGRYVIDANYYGWVNNTLVYWGHQWVMTVSP